MTYQDNAVFNSNINYFKYILYEPESSFNGVIYMRLWILKKTYDTIDRHGMWQMLTVYGVGGKLLKAVQSFYVDSRACVWVGNDVSEWFPVNGGLRQGCVMSPWLFNVYMGGMVREVC